MTAIECAYKSMRGRLGAMSLGEFESVFDGWHISPINFNEETVGAVMANGPELHITLAPEAQGRVWLRAVIRKHIDSVVDQYGAAKTRVMDGHEIGHRVAKLAGFSKVSQKNGMTEYICYKGAM